METYAEYAVKGDSTARRILSPTQLDHVGEAVLALAGEVWVLNDRLMILEEVLAAKGLDVAAAIDGFVPSPALEKRLDQRRDQLIGAVITALTGATGS